MKKKPFYFSIDFEDFTHDYSRQAGHKNPNTNEDALNLSYERVKYFCNTYFNDKKITFFVTGVLARKSPNILKKIYDDGHEIGCHYNYHDKINLTNRADFAKNLDEAIKSIESVIGEKPKGFRAPIFAIDKENTWAYEELAKRFKYDSSYKTSLPINETEFGKVLKYKNHNLNEFYIFGHSIFKGKITIRTGGTFLRLFPKKFTLNALKKTYESGHTPLIYLHPYELTLNKEFWVDWKSLSNLPFHKRFLAWLGQLQWLKLGHHSLEAKLKYICQHFEHQGPMKNLLIS